jgi:hypothetical protein
MKTSAKQFQFFKQECEKWVDKFELRIWSVHYQHCRLKDYAMTSTNYTGMVAAIALNTEWDDEVRPLNNHQLAKTAKHEVIHLLLAKLSALGDSRCVTRDELDQAEHELVRKLEHIIRDS